MKIVLLGKPMSGKGTQAKLLTKRLNYQHISTGDLLRNEVKNESDLGKEAKEFMEKGLLVPDELIIRLLAKGLPEDNFILDGFPRTIVQAEKLNEIQTMNIVVDVFCSDEIIEKRTVKRRMCKSCGAIYGLDVPPKEDDVCDGCASELYQRPDDNLETIRNRLKVYEEQTSPLVDFYKEMGIYTQVNGEKPIQEIVEEILKEIEKVK
ncbi:nucleoside monophosphate kinase [archaeon]|jgi:adenylate kinase|nr:nucleoside monophosphate kinase [archaeon]MBT3731375.1 nucleoside monophosphate kinase [archaeon]MBT4670322.1 nucleoside monophosphate kinase [archaeon]MBT5029660.1 nucleoside monophosphate kinase [archaeon]MBT5287591.1 nucleoside monophosphate kinase [archaeon]